MTKTIQPLEIGLCSWSLKKARFAELRELMLRLDLRVLHLALTPLAAMTPDERAARIAELRGSELIISAGMINFAGEDYASRLAIRASGGLVPDETAESRIAHASKCSKIAQSMGIKLVSTHAGFIPHMEDDRAVFDKLITRFHRIIDAFAERGLTLLFETGQETAADLGVFLACLDRSNIGVNFDPANMLLYGKGNSVDGVLRLKKWTRHVHMKDAVQKPPPSGDSGAWYGTECPLGQGDAKLAEVIVALKQIGYAGPLIIEREAGGQREADVKTGVDFLRSAISSEYSL